MTLKQYKNENYVIITTLKSKTMGKLIKRIPRSRLLISSLSGSALRTHVESSASLAISTSVLKALPGKLDIKRHSPSILYLLVSSTQRVKSLVAVNICHLMTIIICLIF